jgi:type II secretory pathway pseudopilin PulG
MHRLARAQWLARRQDGIGLVEVLVAALLLAVGIVAVVGVFAMTKRQTSVGQQQSQAAAIAEAAMEQLANRPYADVAIISAPAPCASPESLQCRGLQSGDPDQGNPANPDAYVTTSGGEPVLELKADYHNDTSGPLQAASGRTIDSEPLVVKANGVPHQSTRTADETTYRIYRYVSARSAYCGPLVGRDLYPVQQVLHGLLDESPVIGLVNGLLGQVTGANSTLNLFCSGQQPDGERVTVAVVADRAPAATYTPRPVWMSTIVTNEACGVVNLNGGNGC